MNIQKLFKRVKKKKLTDEQLLIISLRYGLEQYEYHTIEEIMEELDLPFQTVYDTLHLLDEEEQPNDNT